MVDTGHGLLTSALASGQDEKIDYGQDDKAVKIQRHRISNDKPFGPRLRSSVLDTVAQKQFQGRLEDLWDTYCDTEFGDTDLVELGEVVRAMVEFLLDLSAVDSDPSTIVTHPGDVRLSQLVAVRIGYSCPANKDLLGLLDGTRAVIPLHSGDIEEVQGTQPATFQDVLQRGLLPKLVSNFPEPVTYCVSLIERHARAEIIMLTMSFSVAAVTGRTVRGCL